MGKHLIVKLAAADREELKRIVRGGKQSARVATRARILLAADQNKAGYKGQTQIREALDVSATLVSATCRRYVLEGLKAALSEKPRTGGQVPKMTGEVEAQLLAAACSQPPENHARWTLSLLRDRLIELNVVENVSCTAIGNSLKKMKLSLGG
ncbi:MAG: helix-turn-helix domain-containing protein [Pirellula sp.]